MFFWQTEYTGRSDVLITGQDLKELDCSNIQVGGKIKGQSHQIMFGIKWGVLWVKTNNFYLTHLFISLKKVSTGRQKRNPSFVLEHRVFPEESDHRNFASVHARHLIFVSNPRFLGRGNHLGPFS